jgi:uncharacterized protein YcnI
MTSVPRGLAVLVSATAAAVVIGAGAASAHVSVASPQAAAGGVGEITFTVPTESDTASTVGLSIQLPTATPLASVSVKPVPGWTATTTATHLDTPVTTDDGDEVSDVVSQVTWTAAPGQGIAPGQYRTFSVSAGPLPKAASMSFPTIQTYSDGSQLAWIDPTIQGQPEPEHPAPTLRLTAADAQPAAATSTAAGGSDDGPSGWEITAVVLSTVAVLAALGGLLVAARGRRPAA